MYNLIIFPVIFFFLNTSQPLKVSTGNVDTIANHPEIYLIKQYWHTAIVFNTTDIDTNIFTEAKLFKKYKLLDIGWGDAEFYQHPGFDSGLAFNALFYPTSSTLRVEGISITKESYFDISEIVIKIIITEEQLKSILTYIGNTIYRNERDHPVILSETGLGRIIFFKSFGKYHLFNTCNTWLAGCLGSAGIDIEDDVVLTEQLFKEAAKVGIVLKVNE